MFTRRGFLQYGIGGLSLSKIAKLRAEESLDEYFDNLDLGVASGDPTPNSVNLWTRVPKWGRPNNAQSVEVDLVVSLDPNFKHSNIVYSAKHIALENNDFTLKVRVSELDPFTHYYYRFFTNYQYASAIGRTKTLPDNDMQPVRFATMSCQSYTHGYFYSFSDMLNRNLDFCIHLGDFIYEENYDDKPVKQIRKDYSVKKEAITVDDYRKKYKLYLSDHNLRKVRQQYPFFNIWDDHEFKNNYDASHLTSDSARHLAAMKAYSEYIPIQTRSKKKNLFDIYRSYSADNFFDIIALDTRQYRELSKTDSNTTIGNTQLNWLKNQLNSSTSKWKIVLTPVMFAPLKLRLFKNNSKTEEDSKNIELMSKAFNRNVRIHNSSITLNRDAWDGYPNERLSILDDIYINSIKNVVFLAGDIHCRFVSSLHLEPENESTPVVAHEIVTASITSPNLHRALPIAKKALTKVATNIVYKSNPHIHFNELQYNGYTIVDLSKDSLTASYIRADAASSNPSIGVITSHTLSNGSFAP